jgi:acetyl-CoA carboxylase biotin carboxyl carrier protein
MKFFHETIKKLVAVLKEEDIDEIEVRRFWTTIRIARRRPSPSRAERHAEYDASAEEPAGAGWNAAGEAAVADKQPEPVIESAGPQRPGEDDSHLIEVVSPMVGTFYTGPDPLSEPFVAVGKRIEVGDVLCIIEAMKIMNEIESETSGVVRRVIARDAQPVEYGQPLFLIESA